MPDVEPSSSASSSAPPSERTVARRKSEEKIVQLMGGDAQKAARASAFKDDAAMQAAEAQAMKRRDSITKVASTMGEEAARQVGTQ